MEGSASILGHFGQALARAKLQPQPYRYWLLDEVLPGEIAGQIANLPFAPPAVGDTMGRRETHNSTRVFFSPENRARFPAVEALAAALQSRTATGMIDAACGTRLSGSYLRIEYCQDGDGFWLEPHTDISAKLFTMLVYLSDAPDATEWGTDVYDGNLQPVARAPGDYNRGLIFIPGADTWHGFARRAIRGVRRSIIINYVKDEWRARHELAFPEHPVL